MQSETVMLENTALRGVWRHGASRKRLLIMCHGYQDSSDNPTIVAITHGLNKKGYDTFSFTFSENVGGFDIKHQVRDIAYIADYFKDYEELILVAGSFAALTAAIATIQLPKISYLITLNGFFGQGALGQQLHKVYIKFRIAAVVVPAYKRIFSYFKRELQPSHIGVPVLVIHSKADKDVYITQSQKFYRQLTSSKHFVELTDANHGISASADRKRVIAEIDQWLGKS